MSQLRLTTRSPESVMDEAHALGPFVYRACLFSGGNDSAVAAHRARGFYDELVWIDTTTAVPGVLEFVRDFAGWLGKPLRVMRANGDPWREMVLGHGFPGPAQHARAYVRLKERQVEQLAREVKAGHPRWSRMLLVTGVRAQESARRRGRPSVTRRGARVYASPLIDWSSDELDAYRREHDIPQSDVAALLHRSGECNCGSFAAPGEREMLHALWPDWFEQRIASLEREAGAAGLPCARWGERCEKHVAEGEVGLLCQGCEQQRLAVAA